jgi:hypothetical protein
MGVGVFFFMPQPSSRLCHGDANSSTCFRDLIGLLRPRFKRRGGTPPQA